MIEPARATWLAFLSLASAWAAAVAGLSVLPLAAAAFAIGVGRWRRRPRRWPAGWAWPSASAPSRYAAASAAVARGLRQGRRWAHGGALGLAFANLFVPPFGTAHGVYALWLLLAAPRPHDPVSEVTHEHD